MLYFYLCSLYAGKYVQLQKLFRSEIFNIFKFSKERQVEMTGCFGFGFPGPGDITAILTADWLVTVWSKEAVWESYNML